MQTLPSHLRKLIWYLCAAAIAVYAIHGIVTDDLILPYRVGTWSNPHFNTLHLSGIWAMGAAVCFLFGAAGLTILAFGVIGTNPRADAGARVYKNLATPLIWIGAGLFLAISWFADSFVH